MKRDSLPPLPIDVLLPDVVGCLREHPSVVVTAPPGAGKTTRIPRALCEAGFAEDGDILVLEPRRLATRFAAARVAEEFGEQIGETVGYTIRFETVQGAKTRIRFLTEGVLSRRILQNPELPDVSVVILDEFHERHLTSDLALAFLKKLQNLRHRLKLVVMSATLDANPIASFLGAPAIQGEGTCFEVSIEHEERKDDRPLHEKVVSATTRLLRTGLPDGHILVFLPGAYEIRRAAEALEHLTKQTGLLIIPLHGDLPAAEQSRAIRESAERKVILATNVAETSITIPGVAAVIDSGLARVPGHSAWSGLPTLTIEKVSRASAEQRSGRAGRTGPGRVLRLYTRADFEARPAHTVPEIKRADLSETLLILHGSGLGDPRSLAWFDPPPDSALDAAERVLMQLRALDGNLRLTETGRRMLRFPVHPRLARLIVEGEQLGVGRDCCVIAALLSERDIRLDSRSHLGASPPRGADRAGGLSDLTGLLDLFRAAEEDRFETASIRRFGLDSRAVEAVDRAQRQLCRLIRPNKQASAITDPKSEAEKALLIASLTAFPDRVARRRATGSRELLLSGGGSALLSEASAVHHAAYVIAVDAEERRGRKGSSESPGVLVRLASAIEPEWLVALYPDELVQSVELTWNEQAGRVEERRRIGYGQVALEENTRPAPPSVETSRLLANAVLARGMKPFKDGETIPVFQARLTLLAKCFPEEELPVLSETKLRSAVELLCSGKRSIAELGILSLTEVLTASLTARQRHLLFREAPERVDLVHRRNVKVHYEIGQTPWIESRLQDFIGMTSVPTICRGRVSLTVHLLAPNGRAVQVTQDLAGFWERHYPAIRRELRRRYPRHAWPDPKDAGRRLARK